jgi:aminopeptidase
MADRRVEKLAKVLVEYSLGIKPGDIFLIGAETTAEPLVREVYRLAVRLGAVPSITFTFPGQSEIQYKEAPDDALDLISPITLYSLENADAWLTISSSANSQELSGVDPARIARKMKANDPIRKVQMERIFTDNPLLRWTGTLFPNHGQAQDAHKSLSDYEDFVFHAMMIDQPDPVASWQGFSKRQQGYCDYLSGHDLIRVVGPDTDISLRTQGRMWINADGHLNFPDGEVFTGPIEDSVNGHIRYTYPTIYAGREAEDVHLWFEDGVVVKSEALRGKELLDELLAMDDGAKRLGEFAIGTNYSVPAFSKSILFDEKIGGTCHLALGNSIPISRGLNVSSLHWDMVCDLRVGGEISADGEVFHRDGQWLI